MEKNKKILTDALRKLPDYTPDDKLWEAISSSLNQKSASVKLARLSSIDPPDSIWDNLDKALTHREKVSSFRQFEPPATVWENIDHTLSIRKKSRARRRIIQMVVWSSAAAAVLILGFFILTTNNTKTKNFNYTEEIIQINDFQDWNDEEQIIAQTLELICSENPSACSSPEFKTMEEDLAFLNQSKEAILQQMGKYSTNTELEIMLTEIELERTSLIKEMIAKTM